MLWLIAALLTKHFIIDFPMQPRWMYANKGNWAHPGGSAHAGLHGLATIAILSYFLIRTDRYADAVYLGYAEAIAHYLIDWTKVNINARLGWGPTTHEEFWWLLGLDQWLHQACYIAIAAAVFL